jgi:hypothetical protein
MEKISILFKLIKRIIILEIKKKIYNSKMLFFIFLLVTSASTSVNTQLDEDFCDINTIRMIL